MKILVLCTGNSCRSQMAEAFLKDELDRNSFVVSAGLTPQAVNKYAIRVMKEIGIDISNNSSNHISDYIDDKFDFIITVCSNADKNCPTFRGGGKKVHIPFDDPADATGSDDEILAEFRRIRDEIQTTLHKWLKSF